MYTLQSGKQHAVLAFSCKDNGADAEDDIAPTLRSMGHDASHANGGGQVAVVTSIGLGSDPLFTEELAQPITNRNGDPGVVVFAISGRARGDDGRGYARPEHISVEVAGALDTVKPDAVLVPSTAREVMTLAIRGRDGTPDIECRTDGTANALLTPNGGRGGIGVGAIMAQSAVRRLTPRECERLQGFQDDWTLPLAKTADGPRYKQLGNSMAIPVIAWIGRRIMEALA